MSETHVDNLSITEDTPNGHLQTTFEKKCKYSRQVFFLIIEFYLT